MLCVERGDVSLRVVALKELMIVAELRSRVFGGVGGEIQRRRNLYDAVVRRVGSGSVTCIVALVEDKIVGTADGTLTDRDGLRLSFRSAFENPKRCDSYSHEQSFSTGSAISSRFSSSKARVECGQQACVHLNYTLLSPFHHLSGRSCIYPVWP